uniref:Solanesyl diphosphate synthase 3, chloroplastic/mitochondrial n=1 Tax=Mesocestoides corti TaxID=53468 RepID=A0A5K3F6L7_MESCO
MRLLPFRRLHSHFDVSTRLLRLKYNVVAERLQPRFSRASVFASKQSAGSVKEVEIFARSDVDQIPINIKDVVSAPTCRITPVTDYAFGNQGKMLRPLLVLLMAACANGHNNYSLIKSSNQISRIAFPGRHLVNRVTDAQHAVAVIAEMIHTASLLHDDLIDKAEKRRGKLAAYRKFGCKRTVLIGNIVLLKASELLAKIENAEVVSILSNVLDDLIRGEFMQLASSSDENQRFRMYLEKTYKKTASLMANCCKAVTILSEVDDVMIEAAYSFGRHLGMAFQLLDDVLDFVGQETKLGKPAGGSDLRLGLATGPVLFAAQQFPELEMMLEAKLTSADDQKKAFEFVRDSNGIGQTRMLAEFHFQEAQRQLSHFKATDARECLLQVAATTLQRSF